MEEAKLIRKKNEALDGNGKRSLLKACNNLADYYRKHNRFNLALAEYKREAAIVKDLGLRLEWATCNRMIGEMYMHMAMFEKALKYEERYYAIAKELKNLVEEQRAIGAIGRVHLIQAQSTNDESETKKCLKLAEKAFMSSLKISQNLNSKINNREMMDMQARALLNIGAVQERQDNMQEALECLEKAKTICQSQGLYEVLHKCHIAEGLFYSKKMDYLKAINCMNKALEVAEFLDVQDLRKCEALSEKAEILCKVSDYKTAKQVLLQAWTLNTQPEGEREEIERNLKAAMCKIQKAIVSTNPSDHANLKNLYEKLGDGACFLGDYGGAVQYYLKMLDQALLAGHQGSALVPIYISLYQTCKDMQSYNVALHYYEKEYELIKDIPKEAYTTMISMAETLYLAKKPYKEVEDACLTARDAAEKLNNVKYKIRALKNLAKYQKEYSEAEKFEHTKEALRALGCDNLDNEENCEDDESTAGGGEDMPFGHDICLQDITDLDTDGDEKLDRRQTNKQTKEFTIEKDKKGVTKLHRVAITGNKSEVARLLAEGHPADIHNDAGFLPLHEACVRGHLDVAAILIDHGADMNDRGGTNSDSITPLYKAATAGHLDIVQLLLEKGAMPNIETIDGDTPLHALCRWRKKNKLSVEQQRIYDMCIGLLRRSLKSSIVSQPSTLKLADNDVLESTDSESDGPDDMNLSQNKGNAIHPPAEDSSSDGERTERIIKMALERTKSRISNKNKKRKLSPSFNTKKGGRISREYVRDNGVELNSSSDDIRDKNIQIESMTDSTNDVQNTNDRAVQLQSLPPMTVKVHVEDKVLLIPLKVDTLNDLSISWLTDEVKKRYYTLFGVHLSLHLMTSDGAIFSESDPLSLVLSIQVLKTFIINRMLSPTGRNKRYSRRSSGNAAQWSATA